MFENLFGNIFEEKQVSPLEAMVRVQASWPDFASADWGIESYTGVDYIKIDHEDVLVCCVAGCKYPVVTSGAVELLTQEELFCALQHELSHLELKQYETKRGRGESLLAWFKRDQLFERRVDDPRCGKVLWWRS